MVKKKGLRLTIFILLIVFSVSAFSVLIANIILQQAPISSNLEETRAYTFGSSDLSQSDYNNNSMFYINSKEGFYSFVNAEGPVRVSGSTSGLDYGFKGKTVKLTTSITLYSSDCDDNGKWLPLSFFEGTFDGQGYTIFYSGTFYSDSGIFANATSANATIKNVKFKNVNVFCYSNTLTSNTDTILGIIVGSNKGTVTSCIVENSKFISDRFKSNCQVAPLVGQNSGTVTCCVVRGSYKIGGNDGNGLLNDDGMYAHYFVAEGTEATYSFFNAVVEEIEIATETYSPSECDTAAFNDTNCRNLNWAYSNWSSSVMSTSTGASGTAWYKYRSNSHGYGNTTYSYDGSSIYYCVYLRVFISWKTISFSAGTGGSVNKTSVVVPSDYTSVSKSGNTATVYNVTVTATPNSGYEFDKWDGNTALFKQTTFLVWFNAGTNTTQAASTGHCVVGEKYSVTPNTTVTIRSIAYSKTGYSYIRISFVDAGGNTRSMGYTAKAGYYINYYSICDVDKTGSRSYTLTGGGDIDVSASLKSYDIEFD